MKRAGSPARVEVIPSGLRFCYDSVSSGARAGDLDGRA